MSKGAWTCFECRQSVRRENTYGQVVLCAFCHTPCRCIGHKIPVPPKRAVKQWEALRQSLTEVDYERTEERYRNRVRDRHALEQQLAQLEAKPVKAGRASLIRRLRRQLGKG